MTRCSPGVQTAGRTGPGDPQALSVLAAFLRDQAPEVAVRPFEARGMGLRKQPQRADLALRVEHRLGDHASDALVVLPRSTRTWMASLRSTIHFTVVRVTPQISEAPRSRPPLGRR